MAKKESTPTMKKHDSGFSTVELLVTLFIASAFISIFYQLFVIIDRLASDGYQKSVASNLAYANMRLYANTEPPTAWFTPCNSTTDLTVNPSAAGLTLLSGTVTAELPPPVTQSVIALAPYGCSGTNVGMPIMIQSTITYGPTNKKISHSTYVGY